MNLDTTRLNKLKRSIVLLLSGGIDSVVLAHESVAQGCSVHAAIFDYKQRHVQETAWAKHHCRILNIMFTTFNLPLLLGSELTDGSGGMIVPCRNSILLSHAVNLAVSIGADSVLFAANKGDQEGFPDCRSSFVQAFNNMLLEAEIPVEVRAPYLDKSKSWIVQRGFQLGVKLNETWSCYRGGLEPCGECEACKKRVEALCGQ